MQENFPIRCFAGVRRQRIGLIYVMILAALFGCKMGTKSAENSSRVPDVSAEASDSKTDTAKPVAPQGTQTNPGNPPAQKPAEFPPSCTTRFPA
jgi:hypothetical protein